MRHRLWIVAWLVVLLGCSDTRGFGRDSGTPPPNRDAGSDAVTPPPRDGGGGTGTEGQLRIVGDSSAHGRLEVFHDGQWGTICDDAFDENDATVACRELGFSEGFPYTDGAGSGEIWMDDVDCSGTEARLVECEFLGWGVHNCSHSEDVGVECF